MRGRIKEDDSGVPEPDGPFAYLWKYREGGQHELIGRTPRDGGDVQILLDGDALAKDVGLLQVRRPPAFARPPARSLERRPARLGVLHHPRARLGHRRGSCRHLEQTGGSVVWGARFDVLLLRRARREPPAAAGLPPPARHAAERRRAGLRGEGRRLVHRISMKAPAAASASIAVGDHETSEQRLLDLADPDATPRLVAPRETGVRYSVEHRGDGSFILTNADGARISRSSRRRSRRPDRAQLARPDPAPRRASISFDIELYAGHLVRLERANALPSIVIRELATGGEHAIAFAEEAYSLGMQRRLRVRHTTSPLHLFVDDDADRGLRLRHGEPRSGPCASARRCRAATIRPTTSPRASSRTAPDGEEVPVSVLHRRDLALDGSAPLLLYGYGSYGMAMPAAFSTNRLSLVDRGFVYAIAHVRGGTEKGWRWYLDGKREKKTNTFTTSSPPARALIDGGLHRGRAHRRPWRQRRRHADGRGRQPRARPVRRHRRRGAVRRRAQHHARRHPAADPAGMARMGQPDRPTRRRSAPSSSYSPYDNVAAQAYPAILALAGLTDPRVTYWEPAKWVARLRATMTGGGPVLLRTTWSRPRRRRRPLRPARRGGDRLRLRAAGRRESAGASGNLANCADSECLHGLPAICQASWQRTHAGWPAFYADNPAISARTPGNVATTFSSHLE